MRRSPVTGIATGLMLGAIPLMGLAFYSVGRVGGTGPLAAKAAGMIVGEGWTGFLAAVDQIAAVAVFLGVGIVTLWIFAREHADGTFASLFALTVSRAEIAAAKVAVLVGWMTALSIALTALAFGIGGIAQVGVEPPSADSALRLFFIALAAGLLALPMGWIASVWRGYLPAVAALILTIAAAQVAVLFGTGGWFPFAVPGILAVAGAEGMPSLSIAQMALVPLTAALAIALILRWWGRAEVV